MGNVSKTACKWFEWFKNIPSLHEKLTNLIKLIKNDEENSEKGYIFEVGAEYTKELHDLHSDLPFLPEIIKINKCKKLFGNLYDKKNLIHIRKLKQAFNHGLICKE